jgi:hypothetical protein
MVFIVSITSRVTLLRYGHFSPRPEPVRLMNVVGIIRHRRTQLFHAGRRLGQRRSLCSVRDARSIFPEAISWAAWSPYGWHHAPEMVESSA